MSEYTPQRLKSAKIKADQLKATGATIVVTSCHNCVDGLTDLIKHYKLDMKVTQLVNLVANALVIEKPVEVPVEEIPTEAVATPAVTEAIGLKGYKILVADDEPDFVTFISTVLEDNGAEVIEAFDGNQALELAHKEKPDLMTLDITMPGKSGIEVFEILRSDDELSGIPVCIMTGKPELRKLIYDRAVRPPEGYVDKPVDEESIILNIRKILELAKEKSK
jgi:adenylate cyclase